MQIDWETSRFETPIRLSTKRSGSNCGPREQVRPLPSSVSTMLGQIALIGVLGLIFHGRPRLRQSNHWDVSIACTRAGEGNYGVRYSNSGGRSWL
jgi:hypothetical protein